MGPLSTGALYYLIDFFRFWPLILNSPTVCFFHELQLYTYLRLLCKQYLNAFYFCLILADGPQSPTVQPTSPVHQAPVSTFVNNIHISGRCDSPSFVLSPSPQKNADPREVVSTGLSNDAHDSPSETQTTVPETATPKPINAPDVTAPASTSSESSEENRSTSSQSRAFSVNGEQDSSAG